MCPFIGFSLDYAAKSQIFETKGKKFYFKRNPQKCGIPQNEISHQKQDISSHIWIIYLHGWFELFLVVLFFLIIFVSVLWTILNDWKFVFDSQSTVRRSSWYTYNTRKCNLLTSNVVTAFGSPELGGLRGDGVEPPVSKDATMAPPT